MLFSVIEGFFPSEDQSNPSGPGEETKETIIQGPQKILNPPTTKS
jgi:hypothetical protein